MVALELFGRRIEVGLVRAGDEHEVALVGRGHIREEVADLQLQERDVGPQRAVAIAAPIDMPARLALFGFYFRDGVRSVEVRGFVEEAVHVIHQGRVVQQVQQQGIIPQDVEDAGIGPVYIGLAGVGLVALVEPAPTRHDFFQTSGQARHVVGLQEVFDDQIAVGVKEKLLLRGRVFGRGGHKALSAESRSGKDGDNIR